MTDATTPLWDLRLKDKIVLISGAGRGIGRACAIAFAQAGANVIASARTEDDFIPTLTRVGNPSARLVLTDVVTRVIFQFAPI